MKKQLQIEKERSFKMELTNSIWEAATACMIKHKYGNFLIAEDSIDLLRQSEIVSDNLIERKRKQEAKDAQEATKNSIEMFSKEFPFTGQILMEMHELGEPVPLHLLFHLREQKDCQQMEMKIITLAEGQAITEMGKLLFRRMAGTIFHFQQMK